MCVLVCKALDLFHDLFVCRSGLLRCCGCCEPARVIGFVRCVHNRVGVGSVCDARVAAHRGTWLWTPDLGVTSYSGRYTCNHNITLLQNHGTYGHTRIVREYVLRCTYDAGKRLLNAGTHVVVRTFVRWRSLWVRTCFSSNIFLMFLLAFVARSPPNHVMQKDAVR